MKKKLKICACIMFSLGSVWLGAYVSSLCPTGHWMAPAVFLTTMFGLIGGLIAAMAVFVSDL